MTTTIQTTTIQTTSAKAALRRRRQPNPVFVGYKKGTSSNVSSDVSTTDTVFFFVVLFIFCNCCTKKSEMIKTSAFPTEANPPAAETLHPLGDFSKEESASCWTRYRRRRIAIRNRSYKPFEGKTLAMIFAKQVCEREFLLKLGHLLGGQVYLGGRYLVREERGERYTRVLSEYNDIIMARVFAHKDVEELAKFGSVPVVNGLSDYNHPVKFGGCDDHHRTFGVHRR